MRTLLGLMIWTIGITGCGGGPGGPYDVTWPAGPFTSRVNALDAGDLTTALAEELHCIPLSDGMICNSTKVRTTVDIGPGTMGVVHLDHTANGTADWSFTAQPVR